MRKVLLKTIDYYVESYEMAETDREKRSTDSYLKKIVYDVCEDQRERDDYMALYKTLKTKEYQK